MSRTGIWRPARPGAMMNRDDWQVVLRPADQERVGYLVPVAGDAAMVTPLTLLGTPLGSAMPAPAAVALLVADGLAALGRRWWCRLPTPLPPNGCDVTAPEVGWDWRPVEVVAVTPSRCRIRPVHAGPTERTRTVIVPIPGQGLLVADPPD